MSALDTLRDMKNRVARDTGLDLDDWGDDITQEINLAGEDFVTEHDWSWRNKVGFFETVAPYTTGTIDLTNGSATVTGTGTAFTDAMKGRKIAASYGSPWYTVKSVESGTSLTLARTYASASVSASTYSIYQDVYQLTALAEQLRSRHVWLHDTSGYPLCQLTQGIVGLIPTDTGRPDWYARSEDTGDDVIRVQIGPLVPDAVYQIRYGYRVRWKSLSGPSDTPNVPSRHRDIVCQGAVVRCRALPPFKGSGLEEADEAKYNRMLQKARLKDRRESARAVPIHTPGEYERASPRPRITYGGLGS